MTTNYQRNRERRRLDNERRLLGESLEAFHRRETAKPPTLPQIYCDNHKNRERCQATANLFSELNVPDLFDQPTKGK